MSPVRQIEGGHSRKDRISSKFLLHGGQSNDLSFCETQDLIIHIKFEISFHTLKSPPQVTVRRSNPHPPKLLP